MNSYKKVAVQSALNAGKILIDNFGKTKIIKYKGDKNIVTDIDRKSENLIKKNIKKNFPDHNILAEETKPDKKKSNYTWLIDPLDGTTNYAHNFPFFCISIALEKDNEVILGVVYNPILKELFTAEKNKGAYLNNKRIYVSKTNKLRNSLLATGFPYDIKTNKNNNLDHFANFSFCAQAIRRPGSAALDQCYVAIGRLDGYWEVNICPWDIAAGSLIVKEAGGKVTDLSGEKINIYKHEIIASNGLIHQQMIDVIKRGC